MFLLQTPTAVNPQDFFTWGTFSTLAGATGIVYIVSGVVQNVFNFSPKWFALVLSIVVSFIGMLITPQPAPTPPAHDIPEAVKYLIAFLNGFLIYASATGSNQLINHSGGTNPPPASHVGPTHVTRRRFNTNWFKQ
jgi:hypothetical protein